MDVFALGLSWLAIRLSTLPADEWYSYGSKKITAEI
jgi:Co/Zn/Cd efflux system component